MNFVAPRRISDLLCTSTRICVSCAACFEICAFLRRWRILSGGMREGKGGGEGEGREGRVGGWVGASATGRKIVNTISPFTRNVSRVAVRWDAITWNSMPWTQEKKLLGNVWEYPPGTWILNNYSPKWRWIQSPNGYFISDKTEFALHFFLWKPPGGE